MTGSKPKLSMKSSSIIGMFIANYPTVMIQNFKLAKDLMNREECCGRHSNIISRYLGSDSGKNKGSLVCLKISIPVFQGIISTDGKD